MEKEVIWIPFSPGCYGSSVEYLIARYTSYKNENGINDVDLKWDASMHEYKKQCHPGNREYFLNVVNNVTKNKIITPITPMPDMKAIEILSHINQGIYIGVKDMN